MTKLFYYDIFLIENELLEQWKKDFFWPHSSEKTQQILHKILEINFKSVEKEKKICSLEIVFLPTIILGIHILHYLITCCQKRIKGEKIQDNIFRSIKSNELFVFQRKNSKFPIAVEFLILKEFFRSLKDKIKTIVFNFRNLKFDFQ